MIQKTFSKDEFGQELLPTRDISQKIITVILSNDSPQVRKDLRCISCGRIVCQYYSEVRVIIINEVREVSRPIDIQCSRCKFLYRIV